MHLDGDRLMSVYLDNAATTRPYDKVVEAVAEAMIKTYGNPSSKHHKGIEAEVELKFAKDVVAKSLKASPKEIIFTSGGTESNNMAVFGAAYANVRKGKRIITTGFEHPSVEQPLSRLKDEGFVIDYLSVDGYGRISLDELETMLGDDVILVSIMYANNEIGTVQDVHSISKAIKKHNKDIVFHVDAVQAYGRFAIRPKHDEIDLLSASGHKIHAPKGVGFLYVNEKIKIKPFIYGGGQEKGMRSGTENLPAIMGLATAVTECHDDFGKKIKYMYELRRMLHDGLSKMDDVTIFGTNDTASPHILGAAFKGIKSEVLLNSLDNKEICVSSGSACMRNNKKTSRTLKAINASEDEMDSLIRFSFGFDTVEDDVAYALKQLDGIVPLLRKYTKK